MILLALEKGNSKLHMTEKEGVKEIGDKVYVSPVAMGILQKSSSVVADHVVIRLTLNLITSGTLSSYNTADISRGEQQDVATSGASLFSFVIIQNMLSHLPLGATPGLSTAKTKSYCWMCTKAAS